MKGRKPYPIELIENSNDALRYTKSEIKDRRRNEIKVSDGAVLVCPRHLSEEAKREWRRIRTLYKSLSANILSDLDVNSLEVYCEAVATYRKAMAKVRETSEVYASKPDNKPKKNPWLTVANEAAAQMRQYSEVLLLDPVSRARAGLTKPATSNVSSIAAFMQKRAESG